ncbi:MAG: class I SAM-dependent methyltransferase [Sedimenticola sp.]|nr:class I SAM-dependent methyltransferase [Sedimenticola sp.]
MSDIPSKPYSESCDQNREPILHVIGPLLQDARSLLEIGSGTGQHAVYFAAALPHLVWHTSDCAEYHPGIRLWLEAEALANTRPPLQLDVARSEWPELEVDAVFSANTAHIMHWHEVEAMFAGVGRLLQPGGRFLLYGPFNYHGRFTSDSNVRFDQWLKARDPGMGVRDIEELSQLAEEAGLRLQEDFEMPANNRILYWQRG